MSKTKPVQNGNVEMTEFASELAKLYRRYHVNYQQAIEGSKAARDLVGLNRQKKENKNKIKRLTPTEEERLIETAYAWTSRNGLLIKSLFMSGARVAEFTSIRVEDFSPEEKSIHITKGKGDKSRFVPILKELAQELSTHLNGRTSGYLFESNRNTKFTSRRIQQIVKEVAEKAGIEKQVYPHLLRHTVATKLLAGKMKVEEIQKFLGHANIDTTLHYAEVSPDLIREGYTQAMNRISSDSI